MQKFAPHCMPLIKRKRIYFLPFQARFFANLGEAGGVLTILVRCRGPAYAIRGLISRARSAIKT